MWLCFVCVVVRCVVLCCVALRCVALGENGQKMNDGVCEAVLLFLVPFLFILFLIPFVRLFALCLPRGISKQKDEDRHG